MIIIQADILDIKEGIIAHQVNQLGVMGGGLALEIKKSIKTFLIHIMNYVEILVVNYTGAFNHILLMVV